MSKQQVSKVQNLRFIFRERNFNAELNASTFNTLLTSNGIQNTKHMKGMKQATNEWAENRDEEKKRERNSLEVSFLAAISPLEVDWFIGLIGRLVAADKEAFHPIRLTIVCEAPLNSHSSVRKCSSTRDKRYQRMINLDW